MLLALLYDDILQLVFFSRHNTFDDKKIASDKCHYGHYVHLHLWIKVYNSLICVFLSTENGNVIADFA